MFDIVVGALSTLQFFLSLKFHLQRHRVYPREWLQLEKARIKKKSTPLQPLHQKITMCAAVEC